MTVSMPTTRLSSVMTGCGGKETTCSRRSISGLTRATKGTISVSPGSRWREWRRSGSTIPARACGTIRTPAAATMKTNRARMIRTIRPAVMRSLSFAHERGRAPDLEHLDAGSRLDDLVVVVGARRPDLAVELHAAHALGVGDALDDHRRLADQRRRTRPDGARALVGTCDRPQRGQQDHRDDQEGGELDRRAGVERREQRRDGGAPRE